jgi:hypothetical protein
MDPRLRFVLVTVTWTATLAVVGALTTGPAAFFGARFGARVAAGIEGRDCRGWPHPSGKVISSEHVELRGDDES